MGDNPSPAQRLSAALADRYRLDRELGAGGMATVYLAEDLKHERQVAIKVLRPELAAVIGAERFLREIKTIAGLQHPHILGLIDSGELDGTAFYVMPFVEGESLRDRLQREKQLPMAEAVRLTSEVASALDYAHRRGVIHRDIKPENILLHDGSALVADFGIALAMSSAGGTRMTETGMSLGTPTYMSPEQAMGEREITAKSDVYALGCVLYEMLVGEPPFTGPTAQAIVAKVMTDEPRPPSQLRRTVPAALERVTLTALAKLPADRYASAAAMLEGLSGAALEPGAQSAPATGSRPPVSFARRAAVAMLLVAVGAAGATVALRPWHRAAASGAEVRQQATYSGRAQSPAISADGRFLAYLESRCTGSSGGGCFSLMVVEVGGTRPVEVVAGATSLTRPRWTHDGLSLVFGGSLDSTRAGLFIVPRLGGTPRRLADLPVAYDTHASADSVALVWSRGSGAVLEVRPLGVGQVSEARASLGIVPDFLAWSPDGRFFAWSATDSLRVITRNGEARSSASWQTMRLPVRWSADGHAILAFQWTAGSFDNLLAFPVDGDGTLGARRPLASQLLTLYLGEFDVARTTGRIVVGSGTEFIDIWGFDLSSAGARAVRLTQGSSWFGEPALSADGRTTYYLRADPLGNSLYGLTDGRETALTADPQAVDNGSRLGPDGRQVSYESYLSDSNAVLAVFDIASGSTRYVPRRRDDYGLLLPAGRGIVWKSRRTGRLWLTDTIGGGRRDVAAQTVAGGGTSWVLSPGGDAVATVTRVAAGWVLEIVPLSAGTARTLATFSSDNKQLAVVAWAPDGVIYVARPTTDGESTTLASVDAVSGAPRAGFILDKPCASSATFMTVAFLPSIRRAACRVVDQRADLMLLDGIRP